MEERAKRKYRKSDTSFTISDFKDSKKILYRMEFIKTNDSHGKDSLLKFKLLFQVRKRTIGDVMEYYSFSQKMITF